MSEAQLLVADALVLIGTGFLVLSVAGVLRYRDTFVKVHAATVAFVPGIATLALASVATLDGALVVRAFVVLVFLFLTLPIESHTLVRLLVQTRRREHDTTPLSED